MVSAMTACANCGVKLLATIHAAENGAGAALASRCSGSWRRPAAFRRLITISTAGSAALPALEAL